MIDVPIAFQRIALSIKKSKISYYLINFSRYLIPSFIYPLLLQSKLSKASNYDQKDLLDRINYYNKLEENTPIGDEAVELTQLKKPKSPKAYYFDTFRYSRYFKNNLKLNFLFGDITYVGKDPSIQKSRPIADDNKNGVLLNLDKKRHFVFIKDHKQFSEKKDMLIGRSAINQVHRIKFMEMYFGHPMCDLGQINKNDGNLKWLKPKISILDHLKYKFILSLEGNDVATNLKWIMSSNSIAVMPKPKYETWFMEGKLIPNVHYILIKDDYSDLEERLLYYINQPEKGLEIIRNANAYVNQFFNKEKEDLISLLVLQKYFNCTSQTV